MRARLGYCHPDRGASKGALRLLITCKRLARYPEVQRCQLHNASVEPSTIDANHKRVEGSKGLRLIAHSDNGLLRRLIKDLPKVMHPVLVEGFESKGQVASDALVAQSWNFLATSRAMASSMPR